MGKHFYGLMLFYTPNEDLSQIRFREKISLHLLKQHTSESSLNWHGLTWIGGTFESDTGGTFHSDMPGTFQSAADGTFVSAIDGTFQSDMSGTFGPMLSPQRSEYEKIDISLPYIQRYR